MKIFRVEVPQESRLGVKKNFQKTLILVFEIITQPPKHTFEIRIFSRFSSLWMKLRRVLCALVESYDAITIKVNFETVYDINA